MTQEEQTLSMERDKQIEGASVEYTMSTRPQAISGDAFSDLVYMMNINPAFIAGAVWSDAHPKNLWKDAQGDELPEIEREVIVLCQPHEALWEVCYAHRPSDSWTGISIVTGKSETYYPKKYDKGGWSVENVKYWLDLELPYNSESELKTE